MKTTHVEQHKLDGPWADSNARSDAMSGVTSQRVSKKILVACLLWTLCLTLTAAGHRLYKTIVAADRQVSGERYLLDGAAVVWVGHGTIEDASSRFAESTGKVAGGHLHALPISTFWLGAIAAFTTLAGLMAWAGRYVGNDGFQSLVGLFAGHFLWLGAVEFGLDAVGRRLGLCGALDVVNGRIVGTHGSSILIQMSAVFLIPVLIGLAMHESNRCAMFQWFRKRLPLTRTASASGRVENYAARTTIQYFLTVWFCYVAVLWLADPMLGQAGAVSLLMAMVAIFVATPYMIWRTTQQSGVGQSLRYSVSGAVVTWTGIEIAASMRLFEEPWLSNSVFSGVLFLGLTITLTALVLLLLLSRPASLRLLRPLASSILVVALLGIGGCAASPEKEVANSPDEIAARLREYDARTKAPKLAASDGLLHALASDSPEMAAQAAVSLGKSQNVSPVLKQQLEAMAICEQSRLPQVAALQALSRLDLLTAESQAVIDQLAADERWTNVAECINQ